MFDVKPEQLVFSFPEVHQDAHLTVEFHRTLKVPDNGRHYPLLRRRGRFALHHTRDYLDRVPLEWLERDGVMLPMYQSEAMSVSFRPAYSAPHGTLYPFAVQVAVGEYNAITGDPWRDDIDRDPQNYLVTTEQPRLDGFRTRRGTFRQFVSTPLGSSGYWVGDAFRGELDCEIVELVVYPMQREVFDRRFPKVAADADVVELPMEAARPIAALASVAPVLGGRPCQEIYKDPFVIADWERSSRRRCVVHLTNSLHWFSIAGKRPPKAKPAIKRTGASPSSEEPRPSSPAHLPAESERP